jgi:hypothetical protein
VVLIKRDVSCESCFEPHSFLSTILQYYMWPEIIIHQCLSMCVQTAGIIIKSVSFPS